MTVRKTKDVDLGVYRDELAQVIENVIADEGNFESSYDAYRSATFELLNKHSPMTTINVSKQHKPKWIDEEYKEERARRRKMEKKWKRTKNEEDHKLYVNQRKMCAQLSTQKQEAYYSKQVDGSSNNQKSLFKIVEQALDKKDDRVLPTHEDPVVLANEFNNYYIDKIDKLRKSIPPVSDESVMAMDMFVGDRLSSFTPTTEKEMKEIIQEFGVKTSPEDTIPVQILKSVMDITLPGLVKLVNKSLSEGTMDGVKHSVIDPLLKKAGLDYEIKKNYRPVNNLIFFSKITERIVLKRLDEHMLKNNLFNDDGFGYKKDHSTETMMYC